MIFKRIKQLEERQTAIIADQKTIWGTLQAVNEKLDSLIKATGAVWVPESRTNAHFEINHKKAKYRPEPKIGLAHRPITEPIKVEHFADPTQTPEPTIGGVPISQANAMQNQTTPPPNYEGDTVKNTEK